MSSEIRKDEAVEIFAAANGFVVKRPHSYANGPASGLIEECMVFESFAGLSAWLDVHFTHRQPNVFKDMSQESVGG